MLRRLIGRYFDGALLFSLTGFVIGIIFAVFHLLGKQPLLRYWLHIAVTSLVNVLNVRRKIPFVIPSILGAFLPLTLSMCAAYSEEPG
jgi:ABC-type methionine transport system permease subunit